LEEPCVARRSGKGECARVSSRGSGASLKSWDGVARSLSSRPVRPISTRRDVTAEKNVCVSQLRKQTKKSDPMIEIWTGAEQT
jgi:hypothetical protein